MKEHRAKLSRLLDDDRLSPNRRMLGLLISLYLDADQKPLKTNGVTIDVSKPFDIDKALEEKEFFKKITIAQFGNSNKIRWLDYEDTENGNGDDKIDQEAGKQLRDIYEKFLPESKKA